VRRRFTNQSSLKGMLLNNIEIDGNIELVLNEGHTRRDDGDGEMATLNTRQKITTAKEPMTVWEKI
jgi:hypothetical protein